MKPIKAVDYCDKCGEGLSTGKHQKCSALRKEQHAEANAKQEKQKVAKRLVERDISYLSRYYRNR